MAKDVNKWIPSDEVRTVGGKWAGDLDIYGTLRQILIAPKTPDTTYDVGIKDEGDMVNFSRYGVKGYLATDNLDLILFPGLKRIIIENASRDEDFKIKLIYQL